MLQAAKWILKFEDLPGIEFWADPKLILKPRGIVMASAADILVAPYMTDIFEEALKEAFLPFEILIPNLQVCKPPPYYVLKPKIYETLQFYNIFKGSNFKKGKPI